MKKVKAHFIDRHEGGEHVVLVHIDFLNTHPDALSEFKELALSSGVQIASVVTGKRSQVESKFFVGSGKAEEIREVVLACEADAVLFNHELTPGQERNLEKLLCCRVLDRTGLILDIFAQRARTFEGKLQVELAQLQHLSTRLVRGWTHLERQKGGIGLRGPGETQLETDRRLLSMRIKSIHKRLDKVEKQRHQGRRARQRAAIPTLSLVGYTNAGKSTLFNHLTSATVYVADQLFATLDPTLRHLRFPQIGKVILADTVGFIRDLPHELVAAFRATLEETCQANLLLHVIDSQQPDVADAMEQVHNVLEAIGAGEVPQLQVYNKIDWDESLEPRIDRHADGVPYRVWLSALTGEGFDLLEQAVSELLRSAEVYCSVTLPPEAGKLRAILYEKSAVLSEHITAAGEHVLTLNLQLLDYEQLFQGQEERYQVELKQEMSPP